jgi:hypothetical protein
LKAKQLSDSALGIFKDGFVAANLAADIDDSFCILIGCRFWLLALRPLRRAGSEPERNGAMPNAIFFK